MHGCRMGLLFAPFHAITRALNCRRPSLTAGGSIGHTASAGSGFVPENSHAWRGGRVV